MLCLVSYVWQFLVRFGILVRIAYKEGDFFNVLSSTVHVDYNQDFQVQPNVLSTDRLGDTCTLSVDLKCVNGARLT